MGHERTIAQPTQQEMAMLLKAQADQQQQMMQAQFKQTVLNVAHELYVGFVREAVADHKCRSEGLEDVTQDQLRRLATFAARFSPYVLEAEGVCKIGEWKAEPAKE